MTAPTLDELVAAALEVGRVVTAGMPPRITADIDQERASIRDACAGAGLDLADPQVAETILRLGYALARPGNVLSDDWMQTADVIARHGPPPMAASAVAHWFTHGWVSVAAAETIDQAGAR